MNIQQEISEAIQKHLPATVGKELQQRLALVDTYEAQLKSLQTAFDEANATILKYEKLDREEQELHSHAVLLDRREAALKAREDKCALNEVRLECAELRVRDLKEVTNAVFANARFKYSTTENMSGYDQHGSQNQTKSKETISE